MTDFPYMKATCAECPWRKDVAPGHFPASRFKALAHTAYDMASGVFACHMSTEERATACAGYVIQQSAHNFSMRMARQRFNAKAAAPLFENYREMAIANGVDPDDPDLAQCRDDGQR